MESAFYGVAAIYGEEVSNRRPNTKCLICKDIPLGCFVGRQRITRERIV